MSAIMIQGAGSNVGKSLIVAGLCRALKLRGLSVAPFKPQNMSNNAAVTVDGGEIGRAQALQAMACGLEPHTDMNPVLLKPESEVGSQVVVQGKRVATVKARDYARLKPSLMQPVLESFHRLKAQYDLVIVEGFKQAAHPKIEVRRTANAKPWLHPEDPRIVAVASDTAPPGGLPWAELNDIERIADFALHHAMPWPG